MAITGGSAGSLKRRAKARRKATPPAPPATRPPQGKSVIPRERSKLAKQRRIQTRRQGPTRIEGGTVKRRLLPPTPRPVERAAAQGVMASPAQRRTIRHAVQYNSALTRLTRQGWSQEKAVKLLAGLPMDEVLGISTKSGIGSAITRAARPVTRPLFHVKGDIPIPFSGGVGPRRAPAQRAHYDVGVSPLDIASLIPAAKGAQIGARAAVRASRGLRLAGKGITRGTRFGAEGLDTATLKSIDRAAQKGQATLAKKSTVTGKGSEGRLLGPGSKPRHARSPGGRESSKGYAGYPKEDAPKTPKKGQAPTHAMPDMGTALDDISKYGRIPWEKYRIRSAVARAAPRTLKQAGRRGLAAGYAATFPAAPIIAAQGGDPSVAKGIRRLPLAFPLAGYQGVTHPDATVRSFQEALIGLPVGLAYATAHPVAALEMMRDDIVRRYGPLYRGDTAEFNRIAAETGLTPYFLDALAAGGGASQVIGRLGKRGLLGREFQSWMERRPDLQVGRQRLGQKASHGVAGRAGQHFLDFARRHRNGGPYSRAEAGAVRPLFGALEKRKLTRLTARNRAQADLFAQHRYRNAEQELMKARASIKGVPGDLKDDAWKHVVIHAIHDEQSFVQLASLYKDLSHAERLEAGYDGTPRELANMAQLAEHPEYFTPSLRAAADRHIAVFKDLARIDPAISEAMAEGREWAPLAMLLRHTDEGGAPPEPPAPRAEGGTDWTGGGPDVDPTPEPGAPGGNFLLQGLTPTEREALRRVRRTKTPGNVARRIEDVFPGIIKTHDNHTILPGDTPAADRFGEIDRQAGGQHLDNIATPEDLFGGAGPEGLHFGPEEMHLVPGAEHIDAEMGGSVQPGMPGFSEEGRLRNELRKLGVPEEDLDAHMEAWYRAKEEADDWLENEATPEDIAHYEEEFDNFAEEAQQIDDLPEYDPDDPEAGMDLGGDDFADENAHQGAMETLRAIGAMDDDRLNPVWQTLNQDIGKHLNGEIDAAELERRTAMAERAMQGQHGTDLRGVRDDLGQEIPSEHRERDLRQPHIVIEQGDAVLRKASNELGPNHPLVAEIQHALDEFRAGRVDADDTRLNLSQLETQVNHLLPPENTSNPGDAARRQHAAELFSVDPETDGMPDWYDDEGYVTKEGLDEAAFEGFTVPDALIKWPHILREFGDKPPARVIGDLIDKPREELTRAEVELLGAIHRRSKKVVDQMPVDANGKVTLYRAGRIDPDRPTYFATKKAHAQSLAQGDEVAARVKVPRNRIIFHAGAFPEIWKTKSQLDSPDVVAITKGDHERFSPKDESVEEAHKHLTDDELRAADAEHRAKIDEIYKEGPDRPGMYDILTDLHSSHIKIGNEMERRGLAPPENMKATPPPPSITDRAKELGEGAAQVAGQRPDKEWPIDLGGGVHETQPDGTIWEANPWRMGTYNGTPSYFRFVRIKSPVTGDWTESWQVIGRGVVEALNKGVLSMEELHRKIDQNAYLWPASSAHHEALHLRNGPGGRELLHLERRSMSGEPPSVAELQAGIDHHTEAREAALKENRQADAGHHQRMIDSNQRLLNEGGGEKPPGDVPPLAYGGEGPGPGREGFNPLPESDAAGPGDDLESVKARAEAAGLHGPGYWPSQFTPRLRGGTKRRLQLEITGGLLKYTGAVYRLGLEDAHVQNLLATARRSTKRASDWNRAADEVQRNTLPYSGSVTEIAEALKRDGIDPKDVVLLHESLLRTLQDDPDYNFPLAIDEATWTPGTTPQHFAQVRGLRVLPRSVVDALSDVPGGRNHANAEGALRVSAFLKTKASRVILGSLNVPWLQFQVLSNVAMTGLARTGPMDFLKAQAWWHGLDDDQRMAIEPYLGQGHFTWDTTTPPVFGETDKRLVNAYRALKEAQIKIPGTARHIRPQHFNPLNWMFAADRTQNAWFRKAVLYSQVKRDAYHRLGESYGKVQETQERVANILGKGPQEQMEAVLRDKGAMQDHAEHVNEFLGDYLTFTPKERNVLASNVMFYAFLRYSVRLVFYTMPVRHPVTTAILGKLGLWDPQETKKLLGPGLMPYMLGAFYTKKDGSMAVDFSRANPALSALTQSGSVTGLAASILAPHWALLLNQITRQELFSGRGLRLGDKTEQVTQHSRFPVSARGRVLLKEVLGLAYPYRVAEKIAAHGRPVSSDSLLFRQKYTKFVRGDIVNDINLEQQKWAKTGLPRKLIQEIVIGVPRPSPSVSIAHGRERKGKRQPSGPPLTFGGGNTERSTGSGSW